ncbi:PaaI family thioesterase [Sulfurimonas sp. SAG-AH-194-C20]|nr:PaaI family thioesterase [Sulfurimonas sp. SAG-AH-194-C20]MDF1879255.1 PaaI family thioesterase [Sulfurimonas sp. SAG-AH-194-C20]
MIREENIEEDLQIDAYNTNENEVMLSTHERVNPDLCGEVLVLERGYIETRLRTIPEMVADDVGLIHGGFIFGAADYAAMLAVNEKNVVLVASSCQFLSPVKFHDEVKFVARVRHKEGRKRNVNVEGHVLDIKVFEGEFKTVVTERHVLKLHLLDEDGENLESGTPIV